MSRNAAKKLASEVGGALPEAFNALDDAQIEVLRQAYVEVRQAQRRELDEALTGALEHVPALMRRPIRKILGI